MTMYQKHAPGQTKSGSVLFMKRKKSAEQIAKEIANQPPSPTDPNGSYTGKPVDRGEKPVQDADDL